MSVNVARAGDVVERRKRSAFSRHYRLLLAYGVLLALLIIYYLLFPRVLSLPVITNTLNQGMALAITAMAQTLVILTAGIDLSIGSIVTLANVIAATQMRQGVPLTAGVCVLTLGVGALAGALNGALVASGRLAPIIVTLATSSIFHGVALYVLPRPGGNVPEWYTNLLTGRAFDIVPAALILLILIIVFVWVPLKRSPLGQAIYAVGSSESSARMSGVNTRRTKLLTYTLAGTLSALAGLLLTAQTATGEASQGGAYTLNSIAATVIGGTAFSGGVGGAGGSIAGAYIFSIIPNVLFAARVSPFMKELLQGAILVLTIAVGAARVFRIKNRLDILR
jgi:ribose transport system permease protein